MSDTQLFLVLNDLSTQTFSLSNHAVYSRYDLVVNELTGVMQIKVFLEEGTGSNTNLGHLGLPLHHNHLCSGN